MPTRITAEVVLRKADGTSILDADGPITAVTINQYRVEKEVIDDATQQLNQLGLTVVQTGATSVSVETDQTTFETLFGTKLNVETDVDTNATHYTTTAPVKIPPSLQEWVADVILPEPPQFFP